MSKPDLWMPFYVGDYLADTMHLTTEQHGAYLLLLLAYWMRGAPLPTDPNALQSMTRMDAQKWAQNAPVILAFFTEENGQLFHKRVEHELAKARINVKNKQIAGAIGGQKRWGTNSRTIAPAIAPAMPVPSATKGEKWQNDSTCHSTGYSRGNASSPSPSPSISSDIYIGENPTDATQSRTTQTGSNDELSDLPDYDAITNDNTEGNIILDRESLSLNPSISRQAMSNRQGLPFPPAKLNTPAFVKAWGEWMTHMGQMNKPMTPLSASKIFTKLEALGPDRAVVAIEHSIASSWVSINEPITRTNGHSNGAHETRHEAERRKKKEREFTEPPRNMKIL